MLDALFPHQTNVARYLPAISHGYAKSANDVTWQAEGLLGPMLNYLRSGSMFHYPATLASAGQVMQESGSLSTARTNITERDRKTSFVVADSGGFQIQQGTLGPWRYAHTVLQSLRWQEDHGDYVMALDFPTGGIATGKMAAHVHRLIHVDGENLEAMSRANGLSVAFNGCLRQTYINTETMLIHRQPERGFLVVLQGTSEPESREWYRVHRPLIDAAEGIAFAGTSNTSYRLMLHRLVDMRDDGTLARIKHIHVLGTGTLASACVLTTMQRCIRASINPDLQITFDTATPFQEANERYSLLAYYVADNKALSIKYDRPSDAELSEFRHHSELTFAINDWCHARAQAEVHRLIKDAQGSYPAMHGRATPNAGISIIGQHLAVNDVAVVRPDRQDPDPRNFIVKPDSKTSLLMCAHNVDAATRALEQVTANWLSDDGETRNNFPVDLLVIRSLIEIIFAPNRVLGLMDELNEQPPMKVDYPTAEFPSPIPSVSPYQAHDFIEQNRQRLDALVL
ncbi:hypothetical protein ABZT49_06020 [Methylobacterium sp. EM32]|uniref:hypothetical protein n=1 Tax=Methylobacterium sp. EM32 TaxID=3163481 RepID=UPI0033B6EA63